MLVSLYWDAQPRPRLGGVRLGECGWVGGTVRGAGRAATSGGGPGARYRRQVYESTGPAGRARAGSFGAVLGGLLPPLLAAACSAAIVWLTWRIFVLTTTGQLLDDAAWKGSQFGRERLFSVARPVLDVVSIPFLVIVVVAAFVLAAVQRRWSIAVAAVVLLAGANVTTQLLKEQVLTRPDLGLTDRLMNSLPSGHTTVAASVAAAALLIAPARWRGPVALAGFSYAALTGLGTLIGGWHRPADVVAAYAVAACWYFLIEAARVARLRALPRGYGDAPPGNASAWLLWLAGLGGVAALIGGVLTFTQLPAVEPAGLVLAYLTSCAGVVAAAAVAMVAMLAMRPYGRAKQRP